MPSPRPGTILIDADTLVYRIGFLYLGEEKDAYINALERSIGTLVKRIVELTPKVGLDPLDSHIEFCFTGKGTKYRSQFNNTCVYKASRAAARKPVFIEEMKSFVEVAYDAAYIECSSEWGEADDYVSIRAWEERRKGNPYLVVGNDKDLLQIPGHHYVYTKDKLINQSLEDANKQFFIQLLTGDSADSVPGIRGIGIKSAQYLLGGLTEAEDMYNAVEAAYLHHYRKDLTEEEIADLIYERANMLWIRRNDQEIWYPPLPSE